MTSLFAPKPAGTGLFGASSNATPTNSLFGASTSTAQPSGGLFGASQPAPSTGLFGASQPTPSTGLFGASTAQPQSANTGLFGAQPQSQSTSLFGQSAQPQATSLFGAQPQQPQNNFAGSLAQGLNASTNNGALHAQTQRELVQSRLQAIGLNNTVREKSYQEQIETLYNKWNPQSGDTLLQAYIYNAANPTLAPFYYPSQGESERDYEAALANKPEDQDGNTWVPMLVRGFRQLADRIEYQAKFVQNMQVRLHEMNNALTAIMQKHSQDLSVRIDSAKRQHTAVSARTLRLAVKCQVLRNRGYALDSQEEGLRTTLMELERKVQDPVHASKEQELWAKMLGLRERAHWLENEGKKISSSVNGQGNDEKIPANVLDKACGILRDYDAQIQQLVKEVNAIQQDFREWSESRTG